MNDTQPCTKCSALIDGTKVGTHAGLLDCSITSLVDADFNLDTYRCCDCGTKFQRHEAKPSRRVTWTVIE
jgi:hypothetical protein